MNATGPSETGGLEERLRQREERYRRQFVSERAAAEVLVLSFPKAGRTWHRLLLGHYLAQLCGASDSDSLKLSELCVRAGTRAVVYSHNGANFLDGLPPSSPAIACPSLWQDRDVLLLVRDPRDIVVSAYHHAVFRSRSFVGTLPGFLRDPRLGVEKILTAFNRWHANRHLRRASQRFLTKPCMLIRIGRSRLRLTCSASARSTSGRRRGA